jgi:hypothetical protein
LRASREEFSDTPEGLNQVEQIHTEGSEAFQVVNGATARTEEGNSVADISKITSSKDPSSDVSVNMGADAKR